MVSPMQGRPLGTKNGAGRNRAAIISGIAARMKTGRECASMSQRDLARASGVNMGQIENYENGRNLMSVDVVLVLASAMGAAPEWLAFGRGKVPKQAGEPCPV